MGSMTAPYYNSRATKIAVVTNGEGYFEMACPHLSSLEFGGLAAERKARGREDRTKEERRAWPKLRKWFKTVI
ncbi:Cupincin [Camellia lanceoleosa]|uniref:Cupincin n=1 Tax=Camellia lanceoleosa TaxID=1840588 RepID=A0ACC0I2R0_9ERIC|nr:Cupincin [Camellia lanceoleosa]